MTQLEILYRFAIALGLGLLLGLQREHAFRKKGESSELFAGVRTFPLLALIGCTAAFVATETGSIWLLVTPLALTGALVVAVYVVTAWRGDVGMTTEVAAILTLLLGTLCFYGRLGEAVALGVIIMALLALRLELRGLASRVTNEDLQATLKFGLITAVILPVIPNRSLGQPPFDVLNPHKIWLMVVLISGLGFIGYLLIKVVGTKRGIGITGFLGGLVSSTAVTLTFSERSSGRESLARAFAVAITVAWTTMFARVIVEVMIVNRGLLAHVWVPMAVAGGVGLASAAVLYSKQEAIDEESPDFSNPFELGPALKFGVLYAVILVVSRFAQLQFGDGGIYVSSILAGLTDVDAITLSMAELSQPGGGVEVGVASRAVTLAAMSNTVVKAGIVMSTGGAALRKAMLPGSVCMIVAGLAAAFLS